MKFLDSLKRFRVAQNILGLVEGQGIRAPQEHRAYKKKYFLLAEGGI